MVKQTAMTVALIMLSLLFTSTTFGQIPGVIGIKLAFTGGYATSDDLAPTDQAGVVAVTNWNNLQASISSGGSVAQRVAAEDVTWNINQDSAGNTLSGVTLTAGGFDDGWYNGGNECANGRLLYDFWKVNTGAYSQAGFSSGAFEDGDGKQYATCTINNLPAPVYDVYVYINDNNNNYWGNVEANSIFACGNNPDSDGFNGGNFDPCDANPEFVTASTYNGGNTAFNVNYVKMPHVAPSGGAITVTITEQGGEIGVAGIELVPASDIALAQDIEPNYAETVAGDQVIFTAAYSNSPPVNLQWVDVSGGVTNTVNTGMVNVTNNGVVTSTLTLNNVQRGNSGAYQLEAINANNSTDVAYSDAASLVVGSSPPPTNNIIVDYAGQAGPVTFYPSNWTVNTANDLVYNFPIGSGLDTLSPGPGDFTGPGDGTANSDPAILDDGTPGNPGSDATIKSQLVGCGPASVNGDFAGGSVTYTLSTNLGAPYGFDLTNITVYGGWTDPGRNEQDYQVLYSTVQDPTNFVVLALEDYTPADPNVSPSESRTKLIPATGVLAHNVYAVEFNFVTSIYPHNGWEGYSQIVLEGPPSAALVPVLVQDITPLAAEDVVGGSLIMTAAFADGTVQWQNITGGVTNNINTGVVNVTNNGIVYSTLTVTPLTMSSAGNYRATASSMDGIATSSSCQVTVEPAPAAVGNVITAWAYQTSDVLPFGPTWSTNELSSSLIYRQDPPSGGHGSGDFTGGGDDAGGLPVLTDGNYGEIVQGSGGHPAFAACGSGAGQYVIYTMPDSGAYGDDITNIQIAGGWNDNGRNTQEYTVYYSTVSDPTNFFLLTSVSNSPDTEESEIRATFTPASGLLARNVAQIYIDFTTPPDVPNGYSGYSEISVFGKASASAPGTPVPPVLSKSYSSNGNLILSGTGGTPNAAYTLLTTTNLLLPIVDWTPLDTSMDGNGQTVTTEELSGNGAFSNAIPINAVTPASFFTLKIQQ